MIDLIKNIGLGLLQHYYKYTGKSIRICNYFLGRLILYFCFNKCTCNILFGFIYDHVMF